MRLMEKSGTILVVDDDSSVRDSLSAMLDLLGWSVEASSSGQDAVTRLRDGAASYSVVLLDISLPDMSGLEVILELDRLNIDVPILLVSGGVSQPIPNSGRRRWLPKPFGSDQLQAELGRLLSDGS
ncbi:MAG: response regulator [Planctomycetales bacterium]|nr:response regulator [Planctomycetales bacterium]